MKTANEMKCGIEDGKMNFERNFLKDMLKTMDELKTDQNRERFCINFDVEYEKLKKLVKSWEEKVYG